MDGRDLEECLAESFFEWVLSLEEQADRDEECDDTYGTQEPSCFTVFEEFAEFALQA